MWKFDFSILTKDGQKVESVVIAAQDQEAAERKLKQMYRYCEIVRCGVKEEDGGNKASQAISVEDILTLIAK
jgi:type II secretory pathway component PulF